MHLQSIVISELMRLEKLLKKAKDTFFTKRFLYYSIIGTFATFNVAIFTQLFSYLVGDNAFAFPLGYYAANLISYFLNCYFTYKKKVSLFGYLRFALTYVPNYIISQLVSVIAIHTWHLPVFIASAIAAIVGVPITFIILKVFAFNSKFKQ